MIRRTSIGFVAALAIASVAACSSESEPASGAADAAPAASSAAPAIAAPAAAPAGPSLEVDADKTHAVQPGDVITVTVGVEGFVLDPGAIGAANVAGRGHYRIYLDAASGDDYLAAAADPTTTVTLPEDTTDGSHDLRVSLRNNDGTPLDPGAEVSVLLIVYRL